MTFVQAGRYQLFFHDVLTYLDHARINNTNFQNQEEMEIYRETIIKQGMVRVS